jgi:hypothetical protein
MLFSAKLPRFIQYALVVHCHPFNHSKNFCFLKLFSIKLNSNSKKLNVLKLQQNVKRSKDSINLNDPIDPFTEHAPFPTSGGTLLEKEENKIHCSCSMISGRAFDVKYDTINSYEFVRCIIRKSKNKIPHISF